MQAYLATLADRRQGRPRPRRHGRARRERARNDPAFDVAGALFRMSGVDLTVLERIDPNTALVLMSEIGPDVSRLTTVKHFCSWLGLAPQLCSMLQPGHFSRRSRGIPVRSRPWCFRRMGAPWHRVAAIRRSGFGMCRRGAN